MKIDFRHPRYLLFLILILASFLRLWNLSNVPPHITPDEASLGYNAYSILKTGRDEYGELMPVIFKSFGDYKPGFYIYVTVPFVAIMGLSELSVRLPSAFAGITAVFLLYKIVKLLVKEEEKKYFTKLPIAAAFFLAVSPWHIHFSRGAWEINLSLTLTLAGIYFFLRSFKNSFLLIPSALFFGLTLVTYQGAKLSTLLVLLSLFIVFSTNVKRIISSNFKLVLISVALGFVLTIPILVSFGQGQTGRLAVFSVFSYPRPEKYVQDFLNQGSERKVSISYYLFHSEPINFARGLLGRWFNHYSARFLFFEGDWQNPKHSAPYHGVLTLFDLVFVASGLYIISKFIKQKIVFLFLLLLLLSPLPAALSRDDIHAVRAYNMVIPLTVILSFGAVWVLEVISKLRLNWMRVCFCIVFVTGYSLSYVYFLDMYFVHLAKHKTVVWDYGLKQVVQTVIPVQDRFHLIKVQQSFAQPYIYFLFYGVALRPDLYDPGKYQQNALLLPSDFKNDVGLVHNLTNVEFTAINWPENRGERGVLFAGDEIRIPPTDSMDPNEFVIHNDIFFPDGRRAFRVVEVK